jgi:hypothetical protein
MGYARGFQVPPAADASLTVTTKSEQLHGSGLLNTKWPESSGILGCAQDLARFFVLNFHFPDSTFLP